MIGQSRALPNVQRSPANCEPGPWNTNSWTAKIRHRNKNMWNQAIAKWHQVDSWLSLYQPEAVKLHGSQAALARKSTPPQFATKKRNCTLIQTSWSLKRMWNKKTTSFLWRKKQARAHNHGIVLVTLQSTLAFIVVMVCLSQIARQYVMEVWPVFPVWPDLLKTRFLHQKSQDAPSPQLGNICLDHREGSPRAYSPSNKLYKRSWSAFDKENMGHQQLARSRMMSFFFCCSADLYNADSLGIPAISAPSNTFKMKLAHWDRRLYHSCCQAGKVDKHSGETFQRQTSCNLSAPIPKHQLT